MCFFQVKLPNQDLQKEEGRSAGGVGEREGRGGGGGEEEGEEVEGGGG